jgi:hypothetical protein
MWGRSGVDQVKPFANPNYFPEKASGLHNFTAAPKAGP